MTAPAVEPKAAPKKVASKKPRRTNSSQPRRTNSSQPRRNTQSLSDNAKVQHTEEPIMSPLDILNMAGADKLSKALVQEDDDLDQYNDLSLDPEAKKKNKGEVVMKNDFNAEANEEIPEVEIPHIRKVALKKIDRFNFRLGMEKWPENAKLVPGTQHGWMATKKGDQFLTGLDNRPDDKLRLEKALRVKLDNTSQFYAELTFMMEHKEHGQILNFDDAVMGPLNEVIYFAMLESDIIANGMHEYISGKKPFAEWYIENKDAEAETKQLEMTVEVEAMEAFTQMSASKRTAVAKLLGLKAWGVSDKVAGVELWEYLKKAEGKRNVDTANEFLKVARMAETQFAVTVLTKDAIKLNVIRKNGIGNLTFNGEELGPTEEHVINKLSLATGSGLRAAIQTQVKLKSQKK